MVTFPQTFRRHARAFALAVAITLAQHVKAKCRGNRVGIVLPPGKAAVIANLAVTLAGKTPVNLNFTAGRDSVLAALRIGEVRDCITAHLVVKRLAEPPKRQGGRKVADVEELYGKLHEEAKVL